VRPRKNAKKVAIDSPPRHRTWSSTSRPIAQREYLCGEDRQRQQRLVRVWERHETAGSLALFDAHGNWSPVILTATLRLYNAGTEIDQQPGTGIDRAPRQKAANQGAP